MPHRILPVLTAIATLAACTQLGTISVTRGQQTFDDNCTLCHGADGTGAGPVAQDLGDPSSTVPGRFRAIPV